MELMLAMGKDVSKVCNAVKKKGIAFIMPDMIIDDHFHRRLFVVKEGQKVLATLSLVPEPEYHYIAIKRLCILNKKNCGKGIARFAIQEAQKKVRGKIGCTPWTGNDKMRHLVETEGFKLEYIFNEHWCFYSKEV